MGTCWRLSGAPIILDTLWGSLPRPRDTEALAAQVYDYVWERSASGGFSVAA